MTSDVDYNELGYVHKLDTNLEDPTSELYRSGDVYVRFESRPGATTYIAAYRHPFGGPRIHLLTMISSELPGESGFNRFAMTQAIARGAEGGRSCGRGEGYDEAQREIRHALGIEETLNELRDEVGSLKDKLYNRGDE